MLLIYHAKVLNCYHTKQKRPRRTGAENEEEIQMKKIAAMLLVLTLICSAACMAESVTFKMGFDA